MAELPQVTLYPDDAALLDDALLGEVDALVICREPWAQTAEVDAEEALPLLAETEPLCTRLAAVSPAREELAGDAFAAALEQALRQLEGERPELMEALGAAASRRWRRKTWTPPGGFWRWRTPRRDRRLRKSTASGPL